jgi:hypothetical protein
MMPERIKKMIKTTEEITLTISANDFRKLMRYLPDNEDTKELKELLNWEAEGQL